MNLCGNDLPTISVDKRNTSPVVETGRDLLNRLLAARRLQWEEKEVDRLKAENKKVRLDEWKSKYRPPTVLQEPPGATIPESWVWVSAETICDSVRDGTHDTPKYVNEGIPLVTSKDLTGGRIDFAKTKNISKADHLEISKRSYVENGDVLFAMIGTVGNPLVVNSDREFSIKNVGLFKKNDFFLESRYLKYWLESPSLIRWLTPRLKGSNQKFAPLGLLRSLPVPLAPLSDQKRIVAEIEKQFTRLEAGVAGLRRVQANLKRYRAAVLKAACEGKLVPTEAELARQEGRSYETGAQLLDRILIERRQKWSGKGKYKEPPKPDIGSIPMVPEGWTTTGFEQLSDGSQHAIKAGPFGSSLKKTIYTSTGFKIYGQEQVIKGDPYFGDYFIAAELYEQLKSCAIKPGDILISLVGTTGKVLILPDQCMPGIINPRLLKLSLSRRAVSPRFVKLLLESPQTRAFFKLAAHGGTMEILNLGILKRLPIALPPIAEQERIVAEVDRCVSVMEEIEAVVSANVQRATRLRQSILQRAFEGGR